MQGGEGKAKKKRISLSLHVGRINSGLSAGGVAPGLALPAAVKSVEDHGYALSFGIKARVFSSVVLCAVIWHQRKGPALCICAADIVPCTHRFVIHCGCYAYDVVHKP